MVAGQIQGSVGGHQYVRNYPQVAIPFLIIACTLAVVGTFGNVCILGAVFVNKNLRNAKNAFLVNLAIADLLVTAVADPFSVVGMMEGKSYFDARPALCDLIATICLTSCVTALLSIGGISFNRYAHICHTNLYNKIFSLRNNIILCCLFWVVGFGFSFPNLVGWSDNVYDMKMLECIWNRTHSLSYTIFFSVGIVLTPATIIAFSYLKIYLHVRSSRRRVAVEVKGNKDKDSKEKAKSVKLARTLFLIFLVFVLCWLPYAVLVLIDWHDNFPHEVHLYVLLIAHMHSTLNSIIYLLTNQHFKTGYRMLFYSVSCRKDKVKAALSTEGKSRTEGPSRTDGSTTITAVHT